MTTIEPAITFDFRNTLDKNHLRGIWKIMVDYRLPYVGATASLAVSALAKMFTYTLLGYFIDDVLNQGKYIGNSLAQTCLWIAIGFVGLAAIEGAFSFFSGRLAAFTAEGITRRLRDFLFDHIQRLSFS
jgi:ATP-binding cassette subfamily B protein